MHLISWNVMDGYGGRVAGQIEAITSRNPDIIALQELTPRTASSFRAGLTREGYFSVLDSFQFVKYLTPLKSHSYGELIASKWPIITSNIRFEVPWPEKILSCFVICPFGDIQLHTAHVPPSKDSEWKKMQTLEGIYKAMAYDALYPRILCGDFNTPQEEMADGKIVTWGQKVKRSGEIVFEKFRGQKWDAIERNILEGLAEYDMIDVYRKLNGYGKTEYSYFTKHGDMRKGRRYDHVFASGRLNPVECRYLHSLREKRLSDHSAIEVKFDPGSYEINLLAQKLENKVL